MILINTVSVHVKVCRIAYFIRRNCGERKCYVGLRWSIRRAEEESTEIQALSHKVTLV